MPRIAALSDAQLPEGSRPMVDAVKAKLGMAPNIIRTLAHAPAALNAYLSMSQALAGGALSAAEREEVALAVAQANGCGYCLSAHSLMAKGAGVAAEAAGATGIADGMALGTAPVDGAGALARFRANRFAGLLVALACFVVGATQ